MRRLTGREALRLTLQKRSRAIAPMWSFSFFKPKAPDQDRRRDAIFARTDTKDYLGSAAVSAAGGKAAVRAGNYNEAWRLFHEQKESYMQHAARSGFTSAQIAALDASVHEDLANIRRLEGKHDDALSHLLYRIKADPRPSKSVQKKLPAYAARCAFPKTTIEDIVDFAEDPTMPRDFPSILARVARWRSP